MSTPVRAKPGPDLYQTVTDKIVAAIEAGANTFAMPWRAAGKPIAIPSNATTYAAYRGVNVLSLWIAALVKNYPTGEWASYKQWQSIDAQVRQGEQGTLIVFYKQIEKSALDETDPDQSIVRRYYAKPSWVFNAAQCDGYEQREPEHTNTLERIEVAEAFVESIGAKIEHGHPMACYRRTSDVIEMPRWDWFIASATSTAAEGYYAVLLHELTHWTGAEHRLNRDYGKRFGDEGYAMEELVAEIGSAFLCAWLGIVPEPRPDHAGYVASWLKVLKNDSKAIFAAASAAQEAHEYLIGRAEMNAAPDDDEWGPASAGESRSPRL